MKDTKKLSLMIVVIILLQILLPLFTILKESSITLKSNAENVPEDSNNIDIDSIDELNTSIEAIDSHQGDTENSRLEFNYREKINLTRENLDPENADLDYIAYPRLKKLTKETDDGYKYILTFQNTSPSYGTSNKNFNNNGINIYYTRSKDLINWDKPEKLYSSDIDDIPKGFCYSSCDTFILNDGRIMSVATRYAVSTYSFKPEIFNQTGIYVRYSSDNGATWEKEKQIYAGMCWEPSILQLSSGEIQVYFTHIAHVEYTNGNDSYIARSSTAFQSSGTAIISSIDGGKSWMPNVKGTDKKYDSNGRNLYSAYRIAQQPIREKLTNQIANFIDLGAFNSKKVFQNHLGIQTDENTIIKMTDQMPVAIELNNKSKIAMALESLKINISEDEDSQGITRRIANQAHEISLAYSDKKNVLINGETKEKYWLDLSGNEDDNKTYNLEEEVYDSEGLGLTQEGPVNRENNITNGAGPYIAQFPSGETALSYVTSNTVIRLGNENGEFVDNDGNFLNKNVNNSEYGVWGSITLLSSHCMGLLSAVASYNDKNEKVGRHIEITPMYLNHTINAMEKGTSNNHVLFIGSQSQAQMTLSVEYDENNLYFIIGRLDESITDEDTIELYISTDYLTNNNYKYCKITVSRDGLIDTYLYDSNNIETSINTDNFEADVYVNDTNDKKGGYKVNLKVPRNIFVGEDNTIKVNAILNNKDEDSELVSDTFTNALVDDISTWNKVTLVKETEEYFKINNYTIKDNYIIGIETNTTLNSFIQNIDTNIEYAIIGKDGNTITDEKTIMATGMEIKLQDGSYYKIVIRGDLNSDGIVDVSDLGVLASYIVGSGTLENAYFLAGDLNNDDVVDISDLSIVANLMTQ